MQYRRCLLYVCLALGALTFALKFSAAQSANQSLRVNEAATRVRLAGDKTLVALALENPAPQNLPLRISLEWLDPHDRVVNTAQQRATLTPGANVINVVLPLLADGKPIENNELLWYRLRYCVESETRRFEKQPSLSGLLSLSEIALDIFALNVVASEYAFPDRRFRAHVITVHPLSGLPVRGVSVTGELTFNDEPTDPPLKTSGSTNGAGIATLDFSLPRELDVEDGELKVSAARGDFHSETEIELRDDHLALANILLQTDKPLYQPGQTLRARALAFDFSKRALSEKEAEITIEDPEGTTVFRTETKTSRFGVANVDWAIPANVRLGEYRLTVEFDNGEHDSPTYSKTVKISRYDLPNFTVNAKPDRAYYLPGQNAEVVVSADYLFGQPVKRARVRLVRETEREWNYRKQRWETREAEQYEGETDAAGRCTLRLDLTRAHEDLADNRYRRFCDHNFAVYVTDPTTERTEQRRVDLRVTREAIHVYVLGTDYRQAEDFPLQFYLSTFYADGSPAQCELQISESLSAGRDKSEEPLRKLKTNRYGAAKVSGLLLRERAERGREVTLNLTARDGKGQMGSHAENIWFDSARGVVRIATNQTLYRAGEPLEIELNSSVSNTSVILSVLRDLQLVHSQAVKMRKGRAFVVLPYRAEFKDELTIAVQSGEGERGEYLRAARRVLYPRDHELKLDVRLDKAGYRPGEEARAMLRVQSPAGRTVESALGVTVIDQAVLERARTDREFGARRGEMDYLRNYLGEYDSFAGVTKRDLLKLDLARPLPDGLELVAEILLRDAGYEPRLFGDESFRSQRVVFDELLTAQFKPVEVVLQPGRVLVGEHPTSPAAFKKLLVQAGINFDELRDPWGLGYRANYHMRNEHDVVEVLSAGADKRFDTADDFTVKAWRWPYFKPQGEALTQAAQRYYLRSGAITRDGAAFKRALKTEGFDFDALRDRWGRPYRLRCEVQGKTFWVRVQSGGPNSVFEPAGTWPSDDFIVWSTSLDYFEQARAKIDAALAQHFHAMGKFPQTEPDLRVAMRAGGIEFDKLRDLWGRAYEAKFYQRTRYSDRVTVHYREYEQAQQRTGSIPVTQQTNFITLRSRGADGEAETADDFDIAEFSRVVAELTAAQPSPQQPEQATVLNGATGAISGVVTDASQAVVLNAKITAKRKNSTGEYEARTGEDGKYLLRNLPAGFYDVQCAALGFKFALVTDAPVRSATLTEINFTLEVGQTTETVTVSASAPMMLQTESASVAQAVSVKALTQSATPRLREYFPETLLWQPQLETDRSGRAQVNFKLADNITTWKLSVIASTVDGELGAAEADIRAFQPFFVEHDPPRILTEGDEIALPVVLRNYLDRTLTVQSELKPESWFELLSPAQQRTVIAAGEAARALFNFRAIASTLGNDGKQRITAWGQESDAVEKPVTVHPNGEERTETVSDIFSDSAKLAVNIPPTAIKGSLRAELKIYPNLLAHTLEGIEGILQRPHGCGEQTISSTYPNLLALRYLSKRDNERQTAIKEKARRYLQAGYERLLGYQSENGGFTYWGRGETDLALTAYALRFLNDAAGFITVDAGVLERARGYLLATQREDGSWPVRSWYNSDEHRRSVMQTAFIARTLAGVKVHSGATNLKVNSAQALQRAFAYLAQRTEEIDEPFAIALYALAAFEAGERERAARPLARLRALAHEEAGGSYWLLETNTPFYGWGLAGRLETTALAVRALAVAAKSADKSALTQDRELLNRGLLFLLRNKDRYGVWLSTQATVNVHDALLALDETGVADTQTKAGALAEIFVNEQRVASVEMPPADQLSAPLTVDLTRFISTGAQRVELRRPAGAARATAQLLANYYQPWPAAAMLNSAIEPAKPNKASALRLAVNFDRTSASIGEEVRCAVEAARIGHQGYGMLLAEVGLPPGAEVDRVSLEKVKSEMGWGLNQYDILPDRVVFYLWPQAGGVKFAFKFRPRFGLKAQSAPSVLYDYYNPEARVVLAPTRFIVQ
jgi:hypothetical protein